jgi:hypothetical protein
MNKTIHSPLMFYVFFACRGVLREGVPSIPLCTPYSTSYVVKKIYSLRSEISVGQLVQTTFYNSTILNEKNNGGCSARHRGGR